MPSAQWVCGRVDQRNVCVVCVREFNRSAYIVVCYSPHLGIAILEGFMVVFSIRYPPLSFQTLMTLDSMSGLPDMLADFFRELPARDRTFLLDRLFGGARVRREANAYPLRTH